MENVEVPIQRDKAGGMRSYARLNSGRLDTMNNEWVRILEYYEQGRTIDRSQDTGVLCILIHNGFLRRGLNEQLEPTFKTTEYGKVYLSLCKG